MSLFRLLGPRSFFRGAVIFRHCHADLLSKFVNCVYETHARVFDQESDGVAVHAATEAVVSLAGRADREAGRFFAVERAQTHVVRARLLQRDMAADDLGNVNACKQIL